MKPFIHCPYCNGAIHRPPLQGRLYYEYCSGYCATEYSQYFKDAFDEPELSYLRFSTKNFNVYTYFQNSSFPNEAHIYSRQILKRYGGVASTLIKLPTKKIDIFNLEDLDRKLQTLAYFL
jgi:hypothetical protein